MSIIWTIVIGSSSVWSPAVMPASRSWASSDDRAGRCRRAVALSGQAIGWYQAGQGAGFIGSVVGALIVLFGYGCWRKVGRAARRRQRASSSRSIAGRCRKH